MTKIPKDIIIRAISNLLPIHRNPSSQEINDLVNGEVRRIMAAEYPGIHVSDDDISVAVAMLYSDEIQTKNHSNSTIPVDLLSRAHNPKGISVEELEDRVSKCAGYVKMMTGVANSAAINILRDCHDKLRRHPRYRQRVKQLFKAATISEYRKYRQGLINPLPNAVRFFNLSDMPDASRKKYGALTDEQYFEFWEGTGSLIYQKSQPLIGSLWNKLRLSLLHHGVSYPEIVSWGLVGAAVVELSVTVWQRAMRSVYDACDGVLSENCVESIYRPFCLSRMSCAWQRALGELSPETSQYNIDDVEEHNVALGVEQLMELWISAELPFDSTIQAVKDYQDDIFSTKGYAKKAVRELSEMRNEAVEELRKAKT